MPSPSLQDGLCLAVGKIPAAKQRLVGDHHDVADGWIGVAAIGASRMVRG